MEQSLEIIKLLSEYRDNLYNISRDFHLNIKRSPYNKSWCERQDLKYKQYQDKINLIDKIIKQINEQSS